jgi:hypothetical protein
MMTIIRMVSVVAFSELPKKLIPGQVNLAGVRAYRDVAQLEEVDI